MLFRERRDWTDQYTYAVCFDEVTTTKNKAFSAQSLKQLAIVENDDAVYKTFH